MRIEEKCPYCRYNNVAVGEGGIFGTTDICVHAITVRKHHKKEEWFITFEPRCNCGERFDYDDDTIYCVYDEDFDNIKHTKIEWDDRDKCPFCKVDLDEETVQVEGRNYYRDPGDIVDVPSIMCCPSCDFMYTFDAEYEVMWDGDSKYLDISRNNIKVFLYGE